MPTADLLLFESPPPGKIRAVTWFSAALMVGCIPCVFFVLNHMTRDALSPELAPLWSRLGMAAFIAALGGGFFGGMLLYLTFYATRLTLVAGTDQVRVETLRLFGRHVRTLSSRQITSSSYHHGKLAFPGGVSVDAPWFWVSVSGERSFLLDAQGRFFDAGTLAKLLSPDPGEPLSPPST